MAIEKQPKNDANLIDANQLADNILTKVSHIISLGDDIPKKELVELAELYSQLRQVDKTTILNIDPETINKIFKSINEVNPYVAKESKDRIELNELTERHTGVEKVSLARLNDADKKKIEETVNLQIDENIKAINTILEIDKGFAKSAPEIEEPDKIDKTLATIANELLVESVKGLVGIEEPDVDARPTKEDLETPDSGIREEKSEVEADNRESPDQRLAGEGITKPEKEVLPIGTFPDFTAKLQQDLESVEKDEKVAEVVDSTLDHETKDAQNLEDIEHEVKAAEDTPEDTTREIKSEEELAYGEEGELKSREDISEEVYEVKNVLRKNEEVDVPEEVTLTEKASEDIPTEGGPGSKSAIRIANVDQEASKDRRVGLWEALVSLIEGTGRDPNLANFSEFDNTITGLGPNINLVGTGLTINVDNPFVRAVAGSLTFAGLTTAEIARKIITILRKVNEQTTSLELNVGMTLANFNRKLKGVGVEGFTKYNAGEQLPAGVDTGDIFYNLSLLFQNFRAGRLEAENRKLKADELEATAGAPTEGTVGEDQRSRFSSTIGNSGKSSRQYTGSNFFEENIIKSRREIDEHKVYNRHNTNDPITGHSSAGYIKVYLRRTPRFKSDETEIRYIPFQFEPEISGDGKRANFSAITTLARSQPAYAYRNSEARNISIVAPYLVTGPTTNELLLSEKRLEYVNRETGNVDNEVGGSGQSQSSMGFREWTEDFIYNYVVKWYRQLTVSNIAGLKYKLAPPVIQIWYGGFEPIIEGTTVSSAPPGDAIADPNYDALSEVPPIFRSSWFRTATTFTTFRAIWIVQGISFDYKHAFINAKTKNRLGVDVKLDLIEIGPSVVDSQSLEWREHQGVS